ncbi:MAG: phosphotransferase [Gemmatimonadota bacterium]|nr:phosphotransferase [Gemmatimonadota bacterium]
MIPFEDLTYRGQLRRLRRLALEALAFYDLGDFKLRPLQHRHNATFRVKAGGCRYVLRVNRPGHRDPALIRSELEWLDAITRDTGLAVPAPVADREGKLLTIASTTGVPEPRVCALFRWVKGRFCGQHDLTGRHLERVGRLMGRLHCHAEGFVPPPGFTRIRWDAEGLLGGVYGGNTADAKAVLDPARRAAVDRAESITRRAMEQLGEAPSVFGLIHGDLHQMNYVFLKGEARALDFDDCGWGYYLGDMCATLGPLVSRKDFPSLRAAFLHGYRVVRPLDAGHERMLTSFLIADRLKIAVWMAGRLDNPGLRDGVAEFVRDRVDQMDEMMRWRPDVFE